MTKELKEAYLKQYMSAKRSASRDMAIMEELGLMENNRIETEYVKHGDMEEGVNFRKLFAEELKTKIQENKAIAREVLKCIEQVPDRKERECIKMRYIAGMTWNEIAKELGYSLAHVFRIHKKALERLEI